ncbi:MAG: hypothetical protein E7282_05705 [Lachnospiraceae bacterium]|nr:hypothetical protein [Lachnospiraceae bacterium]
MNVLLLGNGFDLNHKFPTSYINFINVVNFLLDKEPEEITTIGQVLGDQKLQNVDSFIKICYEEHARIYDEVIFDDKEKNQIINIARSNLWYEYFSYSVAKNMTWIDFEKEIVRVLEAFNTFFEKASFELVNNDVFFDLARYDNQEDEYIISCFPFFYDKKENLGSQHSNVMKIKKQYVFEKITGSGTYHLCEEQIIADLYISMRDLADILRLYLKAFVDEPSKKYMDMGIKAKFASLPSSTQVYSFNYTNTYEILYSLSNVDHIHGNTESSIVLGVNPDEKDEIYSIDTSFLQFKKYFQRTFYSTDNSFLKKEYDTQNIRTLEGIDLYVIGHSLDVTDKDIIKLVFDSATRITVLYHSDISVKSQIKNLVEMFGKEGLDRLRAKKDLCFVRQSDVEWIVPTVK